MSGNMSTKVGWIGLGAMGSGMVSSLLSQGYSVRVYDVYAPSLEKSVALGAVRCDSPAEAASDIQVLGLMVVNASQVEGVLFGDGGVADALPQDACIVCFSTVPPSFLIQVAERLNKLGKNIGLVDAPVSGGFVRAAEGQLSVMVSGTKGAIETARAPLMGLTRKPNGNLAIVGDQVGQASDFKLINQVLCAIHIAASAEAMAFGANLGINPRRLYNALKDSSFMFGNRIPWQLQDDGILKSAMTIIHKDAGIVMDEARATGFVAPLSAVTEQLYTAGVGAGLGREEDIGIMKLWQRLGGKPVAEADSVETEERRATEEVGREEDIKLVSALLHAIYVAAAAEALAFARHKGMDLDEVFGVVGKSAASSKPLVAFKDELSWPERHAPSDGQATVDDVLQTLGAVVAAAKRSNTPLFLTQAAAVRFTEAKSRGWGALGASVIGRLWVKL